MQTTTQLATVNLESGNLLDENQTAGFLNCRVSTLRNWRWKGTGPRYRKIGARLVRYHRDDLIAFIDGEGGDRARA